MNNPTSTFNKCTHQMLPGMTGPAMSLHVNPEAAPRSVHTPLPVPIDWQEAVKKQLDDDVNLGVLEKVPFGEPSLWCHRMILTRKSNGTPRRTVDLSPLNPHCLRETHHVKSPSSSKVSPPRHVENSHRRLEWVPLCTYRTRGSPLHYLHHPMGTISL